jgi:MFS family permease
MPHTQPVSYKSTVNACYIGNLVQSIVINLTPVLFIPLREQFGLSFEQLGLLILINFFTQVIVDIAFSGLVDIYGFRPFIVTTPVLAAIGFLVFAFTPHLFSHPYTGFIIGTIIFSSSGGLLELLLSPIVNSIPTDEKTTAMTVLHSFYSWGQVTVVLVTTLLIFLFGRTHWPEIILFWTLFPLINFFMFLKAPLAPPIPEKDRIGMKELIWKPFFIVAFLAIAFGGAAEASISQWTSAFMEKGLQIPKVVGDTAGLCMFAMMMGIGRVYFGSMGRKLNINKSVITGSFLAIFCYFTVALSPSPLLSLAACALCGLAVSLLWPGTLLIASNKYPLAGAWLFAILAAGGDIGASIGPWSVGFITDQSQQFAWFHQLAKLTGLTAEQLGLRLGLLAASVFPISAFLCFSWLGDKNKRANTPF